MSFIREVVTGITENYRRGHRLRNRIDELAAEIAALRQNLGRLHGGSAHLAALNLDPPLVWARINYMTTDASVVTATRVVQVAIDDAIRWVDVEEDEMAYRIAASPANGLFVGGRVLLSHALNASLSFAPQLRGYYLIVAGDTQGFAAEITGERDGNGYPWKQLYLHEDDALTSELVPPGSSVALGRALVGYSRLYDTAITERIEFEAGDHVWIQPMHGVFYIHGFRDAVHAACEDTE